MWVEARSKEYYNKSSCNFRVDRTTFHGHFKIEGEEFAFNTFGRNPEIRVLTRRSGAIFFALKYFPKSFIPLMEIKFTVGLKPNVSAKVLYMLKI